MRLSGMRVFNLAMLLCFCIIIMNSAAFSQQETFKVLASRGKVLYQPLTKEHWQKLTIGSRLFRGDKIQLFEDVYLSLMHSTGKTMEVKKEGTYEISELENRFTLKKSHGNTGKLISFIMDELSRSEENNRTMEITGATERASKQKGDIKVYMPRNTKLIDSVVTFSWFKANGTDKYIFRITDRFARLSFETELKDTALKLNLFNAGVKRGEVYYWSVVKDSGNAGHPDEFSITILSPETEVAIRDTLEQLNSEFEGEQTAVNKFVLASFYERNNLIERAMKEYKESLSLAPDVETYKQKYAAFLIKIGLAEQVRY